MNFSDTGYGTSSAQLLAKRVRRFSRQTVPLQTEIRKLHAPPGTLPWVVSTLRVSLKHLLVCLDTRDAA